MTLDEAIELHIKAATQRAIADEEKGNYEKWNETKFMTKKESEQIIADNRQLAEWLTELKDLREENKVLMQECDRLIKEKGELNELKEKAVSDIWRHEARLKEAKRLLKMAVKDLNFNTVCLNCDTCKVCAKRYGISGISCEEKFKWYYTK